MTTPKVVSELLARSNRLGSEARITNYAGGNTSAKGEVTNPATGKPIELLWVKGSGGDLGTLKEAGLAALDLERFRALVNVYPGVEREDEMVALFDYCRFGVGGAAPSIDTSMHGLVEFNHVDHLHPDSIIALATSIDGKELTKQCFGDDILWVDWLRPGFQLGLDMAKIAKDNPKAFGCVLGGHGLTVWGNTSDECEKRAVDTITQAEEFIKAKGKKDPFGAKVPANAPLAENERHARAAELAPHLRGIASKDSRMIGHFTDASVVLDFLETSKLAHLVALGTSCPDHFLRTKISPMLIDTAPNAPIDEVIARANELHAAYRVNYEAYYKRYATADSPAMRGADPAIILVPGVGMFSFAQGTPLGALLPLLRFLPLPPKGADLRCTVPEGALLEVDLNLHTLARHLPRLLAPMASSDRRRPGWVMLVANGGGGYWYEIGMDFREVLEVTLLSLEDLALNLAEGDPLAADIEARIEQIRPQLDEVHEALAAARKSRRVQKV